MTCRLLRMALLASLVAGPPASGAARKAGKDDLDSTLAKASSFCEGAALRPAGAGVQLSSLRGVAIHDGAPRDLDVPDLVKRFAKTRPMARMTSSPSLYLQFSGRDGDAWALVYQELPACDVMVTGATGDMPAAASRLAQSLSSNGWQIAGSTDATAAMPLSKHVLVKKIARPGMRDFGLMLSLRALAGDAADPTGSQLEMKFLAGEIVSSPGSSDVQVNISFPLGQPGNSSADPQ
jgi:hypothetical protein